MHDWTGTVPHHFLFTQLKPMPGMRLSVAEGLKALGDSGAWISKELRAYDEFGKRETYSLAPAEFVLAMTHESVTVPKDLIGLVEGRSTYARIGLTMHQTAPWIQPGWSGQITLEIRNNGGLTIDLTPPIDRPCQLAFLELSSALPESLGYGTRTTMCTRVRRIR